MFRRKPAPLHLDWLQIEVSARCNSSCSYCLTQCCSEPWQGGLMDMQTFACLRPSSSSVGLVFLQGWGEPLLHPEFWVMVRQARAAGAEVGFTTNAKLLDQTCAVRLLESGVDVMAVSLAGVTSAIHERFRPGCNLAQIDEALTELRELKRERGIQRPRVHIAFMLLRSNWREVDRLVGLATRWGATQVVVSNLTWIGTETMREESILERRELWPEVTALLERTRRDASAKGIEFCYRDPGTGQPLPACSENVLKACFVSHRGDVSPCVFTGLSGLPNDRASHYFEGRAHKAERLVFGSVREDTLPAIWNSVKARRFRESFARREATEGPATEHLPEPCRHCYKLLER